MAKTLSRDKECERAHEETGRCAFESIKEMVEDLWDWQQAGEEAGWTGPHKDKFGATYFETDGDDGQTWKWACADWKALCNAYDIEPTWSSEEGERAIHEDPLRSVLVRDGWREPGKASESTEEYEILLSTGGPATRIRGELDQYNQPKTARLEVQDWFVPWKEWRGEGWSEDVLLDYARCFYFGE